MNEFTERLAKAIHSSSWVSLVKRHGQSLVRVEPFIYTVTIPNIAIGGTASADIQFNANSDFAMLFASGSCIDNVGLGVSFGSALVQMTDRNTNQTFFSEPTQCANVFGLPGYPAIWPVPRVFKPSTRTTFTVNLLRQLSGATPWDYQFNLIGARLYYPGG